MVDWNKGGSVLKASAILLVLAANPACKHEALHCRDEGESSQFKPNCGASF